MRAGNPERLMDAETARQAPLPQLGIVPVGGVDLDHATDFIQAGATVPGVGSSLFNPKLLDSGDLAELTRRAKAFIEVVKKGQ